MTKSGSNLAGATYILNLDLPEKKHMTRNKNRENIRKEIEEIVNRETKAWDTQDVRLLLTVFHHDMVWPWPKTPSSYNPINWVLKQGKYNYKRWGDGWQDLFDTRTLIHNFRHIRKIVISKEGDGAFAVVDIDTLWRDKKGKNSLWKGRVCKIYSKIGKEWKMIMQTGTLQY